MVCRLYVTSRKDDALAVEAWLTRVWGVRDQSRWLEGM